MKKFISVVVFFIAMAISIVAFDANNSRKPHAFVLKEYCVGCGACVGVCQNGAIEYGIPVIINEERCDGCGECMNTCPYGAIWLEQVGR